MPDLETAAVRAWLREHETVAAGLQDAAGPGCDETPEVLSALRRCGSALDNTLASGTEALARLLANEPARGELQQIMAQLGLGWAVWMSGWIAEQRLPDADAIMAGLFAADPTGSGQFLHASLAETARPALLSRLFAPERLAGLLEASTQASQAQEIA